MNVVGYVIICLVSEYYCRSRARTSWQITAEEHSKGCSVITYVMTEYFGNAYTLVGVGTLHDTHCDLPTMQCCRWWYSLCQPLNGECIRSSVDPICDSVSMKPEIVQHLSYFPPSRRYYLQLFLDPASTPHSCSIG